MVLASFNAILLAALAVVTELGFRLYWISKQPVAGWLVPDAELGYRLNPKNPEFLDLGIRKSDFSRQKPKGEFRVLVVGDSVSWPIDGYVACLQDRARSGVRWINGSVPGYTILQERLLFEKHLAALDPDLLILQYCLNDHHDYLHRMVRGRWLIGQEVERQVLEDGPRWLDWLTQHSQLLLWARMRACRPENSDLQKNAHFAPAFKAESWLVYSGHVREMQKLQHRRGGQMVIVAVPVLWQLRADSADLVRVQYPQQQLGEVCRKQGIGFLDLLPVFREQDFETLYLPGDPIHLSAKGHQVLANRLEQFLAEAGLVPSATGR